MNILSIKTLRDSLFFHDLGYADDAAFLTDTYDKLVSLALELQRHYTSWGLTMSVEKTELLLTEGANPASVQVQEVEGFDKLHFCEDFKYLGSKIEKQHGCRHDIASGIDKARRAFWGLSKHIWDVKQISLQIKISVYSIERVYFRFFYMGRSPGLLLLYVVRN